MQQKALVLTTLLSVVAGCSQAPPPSSSRPQGRASDVPTAGTILAPSPADYVAGAASVDLFVIRSSELALQRLVASPSRRLAETMIRDHRAMSAQLSYAGRRLNLLPKATLQPRHQAMLDALQSSSDFGAAYREHIVTAHQEGRRLHGLFANYGASPTLRPVARAASATERLHMDQFRAN